jgi:N-formylglutamate amidohydrolase
MTDPVQIPGVLEVIPERGTPSPMVFDSPHSGLELPADFRPAVSPAMVLKASDTWVDALFDFAPDLGAPFLLAKAPRSFLDLNRSALDVDPDLLDAPWPHAIRDNAATRRGMGLTWRYAWEDVPMYAAPFSVAEMEDRLDRYWRPYHAALRRLLDAARERFGVVYHINCHSMPAVGHRLSPDPPGTVRPDVVIGDYDGAACEPGFVTLAIRAFEERGYTVSLNKPFRGAELVSAYAEPAAGRHSIQIEVNRRLYMDEDTREKAQGFTRLHDDLRAVCGHLRDYAQDKAVSP